MQVLVHVINLPQCVLAPKSSRSGCDTSLFKRMIINAFAAPSSGFQHFLCMSSACDFIWVFLHCSQSSLKVIFDHRIMRQVEVFCFVFVGRIVKLTFLSCGLNGCADKSKAEHYHIHAYIQWWTAMRFIRCYDLGFVCFFELLQTIAKTFKVRIYVLFICLIYMLFLANGRSDISY